MLGQNLTTQAVAATTMPVSPVIRPPPEPRIVEGVAQARLSQQQTASLAGSAPSALDQISASARQFAEVLVATGNIQVAILVSGFGSGSLDLYA